MCSLLSVRSSYLYGPKLHSSGIFQCRPFIPSFTKSRCSSFWDERNGLQILRRFYALQHRTYKIAGMIRTVNRMNSCSRSFSLFLLVLSKRRIHRIRFKEFFFFVKIWLYNVTQIIRYSSMKKHVDDKITSQEKQSLKFMKWWYSPHFYMEIETS
jgi:hypothetical protein